MLTIGPAGSPPASITGVAPAILGYFGVEPPAYTVHAAQAAPSPRVNMLT